MNDLKIEVYHHIEQRFIEQLPNLDSLIISNVDKRGFQMLNLMLTHLIIYAYS